MGGTTGKVKYAVAVNSSSDESDIESSEQEEPSTKIVKKCRKQREISLDEDDIPLMELTKRMQEKYILSISGWCILLYCLHCLLGYHWY